MWVTSGVLRHRDKVSPSPTLTHRRVDAPLRQRKQLREHSIVLELGHRGVPYAYTVYDANRSETVAASAVRRRQCSSDRVFRNSVNCEYCVQCLGRRWPDVFYSFGCPLSSISEHTPCWYTLWISLYSKTDATDVPLANNASTGIIKNGHFDFLFYSSKGRVEGAGRWPPGAVVSWKQGGAKLFVWWAEKKKKKKGSL